ncbi:hypothetical protein M0R04_05810 [Candidatus Dojkabacteria bacterium]|jgi:hypothetical protein|nr:hypothetical protein [Candidatus Dojkabacteria bacterium]
MQLVVTYIDGKVVTSNEVAWRNIPRDKDISSLSVYNPFDGKDYVLEGFDVYFFTDGGILNVGQSVVFKWDSRTIAGFDSKSRKGIMFCVHLNGEVEKADVSLNEFKKRFDHKQTFIVNKDASF